MSRKTQRSVTRKTCPGCDAKFPPRRADQKFCGSACRQRAHRARLALSELDREIEATRLRYWELIYEKARGLGRGPSRVVTESESQYVDMDGNVWIGGVLGHGGGWRLAGRATAVREGWTSWGNEAAGPPWAPPGPSLDGHYERKFLGSARSQTGPIRDGRKLDSA